MIEVIDSMGDDLLIANSARVSFNKWKTKFDDADYRLIRFLDKHDHFTPFGHPHICLRIKMPIFIARQWFKHMIGFNRNEVSRRYVDEPAEFFVPEYLRTRAPNKKQGSLREPCAQSPYLIEEMRKFNTKALEMYHQLLASEVCPEQARMVLPQSMFTLFIETGSLAGYLRLIWLRTEETAQKEIQDYANQVKLVVQSLFPKTMQAIAENYGGK